MSLDAGSVQATLGGRFNPTGFLSFNAAMLKAGATMDAQEKRISASGSRMSKGMAAVGKASGILAVGGIVAFGAAIGKSVSLAADFEQQLSRLKATTGANAQQMDLMKKSAMAAGAATKFSALDAAKAQVELAKGGLSVAKIAGGGLKAALGLAAAGEMDLADAAGTVVNAMKQFDIPGSRAVHVADALATAANTTTADVDHFAMALTQGGSAAKAAGLSLDQTIAVLEAFADNSVKGSDAGTSLKTMLTQLAAPTDKQKNAAKALNLELWTQNGRLKSLPAIARELDGAFGGLTNRQRLAAASTLAGTDGQRGLLALYKSSPAAMQGYLDGLKKQGTAAAVAAEKQNNLRGKLENLKGSLETAGIDLGEGLLGPLTKGAESLTVKINTAVASGKVKELGENIGEMVNKIVDAGPTIGAALSGIGSGIGSAFSFGKGILSEFYREVGLIIDGVLLLGKVNNALPGPDIDLGPLQRYRDELRATRDLLDGKRPKKPAEGVQVVKVDADTSAAVNALKAIVGTPLEPKVMKILADDAPTKAKIRALVALGIPPKTAKIIAEDGTARGKIKSLVALGIDPKIAKIVASDDSARAKLKSLIAIGVPPKIARIVAHGDDSVRAKIKALVALGVPRKVAALIAKDSATAKVKALIALGIPAKTARILANATQALGSIGAVASALAGLHDVNVTLRTTRVNTLINETKGAKGVSSRPPAGSGVRRSRAHGRGPGGAERALTGEGHGPELVVDKAGAFVVDGPTMLDLGPEAWVVPFGDPSQKGRSLDLMLAMFGIKGYAKGKKPTKKGGGAAPKAKPMPIPDPVKFGAVSEDALTHERDVARKKYTDNRDDRHKLDVDIREQKSTVARSKGKARENARRKLKELQSKRQALRPVAPLRKDWQELERQVKTLHTYNLDIERLNTLQETDRSKMETAAKTKNEPAYNAAKADRAKILKDLKRKYEHALRLAKPGSNFEADLEGKLAGIDSAIADTNADTFDAGNTGETEADRVGSTGMTDAERQRLVELEAQQSLASLTAPLDDDKAAASAKLGFLESILGAVVGDPARGGAAAIRDIADQVKSARDNVASLSAGGAGSSTSNDNADLQAQIEQQRQRADTATREAQINAQALSVFQGSGDIGSRAGVTQNIYTLHPGDPATLTAIGDAATAGQDLQGSRKSPRTRLGL